MAMNPRLLRPTSGSGGSLCTHTAALVLNFNGNFDDESVNDLTVTANGDAAINTSVKKFGSGSAYFDGDGDYLTVPGASVSVGDSDFTIECWVYLPSLPEGINTLWAHRTGSGGIGGALLTHSSGVIGLYIAGNTSFWQHAPFSPGLTFSANEWQHIALVRHGDTIRTFLNGVEGDTTTVSPGDIYTEGDFSIMAGSDTGIQTVEGYVDGFRITKAALYCDEFTPPTAPPAPTVVQPCCPPPSPPPCDPYGTYLRDECQGCDYGTVYADGECGEYFDPWDPGGCC